MELLKALAEKPQEDWSERRGSSQVLQAPSLSLHPPASLGTLCARGLLRETMEAGASRRREGSGLSVLPPVRARWEGAGELEIGTSGRGWLESWGSEMHYTVCLKTSH